MVCPCIALVLQFHSLSPGRSTWLSLVSVACVRLKSGDMVGRASGGWIWGYWDLHVPGGLPREWHAAMQGFGIAKALVGGVMQP